MSFVVYASRQKEGSEKSWKSQEFVSYVLKSKESTSPTNSIFTFVPQDPKYLGKTFENVWKQGIWSLQIKQPHLQIARAYTPLPPISSCDTATHAGSALKFMIREERKGEVSGYLHKLPLGAIISLRGPLLEYKLPSDVSQILFLVGGTGIAPALQAIHCLSVRAENKETLPNIHIMWANRMREDCIGGFSDTQRANKSWYPNWSNLFVTPKEEISRSNSDLIRSPIVEHLQDVKQSSSGRVTVDYFVDEEKKFIDEKVLKSFLGLKSAVVMRNRGTNNAAKKLIVISGPDGFVQYLAGSKGWKNGREVQGQLGGLLRGISHSGWEVRKL